MLSLTGISKTYPGGVPAMQDIHLDVPRGVFGLLGPNGAGKSSLMRTIATLQQPDSGSISFDGSDILQNKTDLRVQQRIPSASLVVAGYGSQRELLEELVRTLQLRNVEFTGRVSPAEMGRLLNEADILLNSPDIDNMPLSLIEAQAAGLPVVSTSTGGIPYIVKDGETGLLVPPGDDEAMAAASLRLLEEPGLALGIARAARAACLEQFTWPAVQAAWVRVYRELAASSRTIGHVPA